MDGTQFSAGLSDSDTDRWYVEDDRTFEDEAPVAVKATDRELEGRYDDNTARIVTQRNDFLIPNLLQSIEQKKYINLNPPYQRRLRWDRKQKSKLIESLLMNVPIPPVFLFETDLAEYEVMDGQQRLSTIREFFSNDFPLAGLERWSDLNGRRYGELPPRIQSGLNRRSMSAIILLAESGGEIKQFVFERLNTGGVRLNAQEIRNAIHNSPFNHALHDLSRSARFTGMWDIPPRERQEETRPSAKLVANRLYRQMLDCEIVLRFFTLANPKGLSKSMRASLDDTMKAYAKKNEEELAPLKSQFTDCLDTAYAIYGTTCFRLLPRPNARTAKRALSRGLYDAVMLGLRNVMKEHAGEERDSIRAQLTAKRRDLMTATDDLMKDPDNYRLLVGRVNTKKSIFERIDLMTSLYSSALTPQ